MMSSFLKTLCWWRVPVLGVLLLGILVYDREFVEVGLIVLGVLLLISIASVLAFNEDVYFTSAALLLVGAGIVWFLSLFTVVENVANAILAFVAGIYGAAGLSPVMILLFFCYGIVDLALTARAQSAPSRRRLLGPILVFVGIIVTMTAAAVPPPCIEGAPSCDHDEAAPAVTAREWQLPSPYEAPHQWLIDSFGIGHRLGVSPTLLLFRHAAREDRGESVPHVAEVRFEHCACRVALAEVYSDDDRDWHAYGSRFDPDGSLTFTRWLGLIHGRKSGTGAEQYSMPVEQWSRIRGHAALPCAICLAQGKPVECPSVLLETEQTKMPVHRCDGDWSATP